MSIALFSAGSNAKGQLANGTVDDSHCFLRCAFDGDAGDPLSNGIKSISLAFGANHTLMLLRDSDDVSTLWACGDGRKGQIGEEHRARTTPLTNFRRIELDRPPGYEYSGVAACWETSFIALSHPDKVDILLSMGADDYGDRGVGGPRAAASHESVSSVGFEHLLNDDEQPDSMQILGMKAGTHHALIQLACQRSDASSRVFFAGWGASRHGQLGQSVTPFTPSPIAVCIPDAQDVASFVLGNHHSVFLYSTGRVLALGSNRKIQTQGLGSVEDGRSVGTTWNGTYVLLGPPSETRRIYATGSNTKGQLACSPSDTSSREVIFREGPAAREIVCGSEHVLVRFFPNSSDDTKEEVWGWGWNEHGNLGLGHADDVHEPKLIWPSDSCIVSSHKTRDIWAGFGTTWIAIEY